VKEQIDIVSMATEALYALPRVGGNIPQERLTFNIDLTVYTTAALGKST